MIVACEVSVIGAALKACSKRTPRAASASIAGVRAAVYPYAPTRSARSVSMVMSRRLRAAGDPGRGWSGGLLHDAAARHMTRTTAGRIARVYRARSAMRDSRRSARCAIRCAKNGMSVRRAHRGCALRTAHRGSRIADRPPRTARRALRTAHRGPRTADRRPHTAHRAPRIVGYSLRRATIGSTRAARRAGR